jgi:hypothetical protein
MATGQYAAVNEENTIRPMGVIDPLSSQANISRFPVIRIAGVIFLLVSLILSSAEC